MRMQALVVRNIDRPSEERLDVADDTRIIEHADLYGRIEIEHHVDIAVVTGITPRDRAEQGSTLHAAATQFRLMGLQRSYDLISIHNIILSQ